MLFQFDNEPELREVTRKLWEHYGVTGEMSIRPLGEGRWRLEICSEKELRDGTLEKFEKYRTEMSG